LVFGQDLQITGTITDRLNETIPGVSVQIDGSDKGVVSDMEGKFKIESTPGNVTLRFSHVAFQPFSKEISLIDSIETDIGVVVLSPKIIELSEVQIISSYISDRNTPVAFSAVKARTIEQKSGNQDLPEILKFTPGIYATSEGGGTGDNRLTLRGFQQENISVLVNGVPVSSMENGLVYWSNWSGLADATEVIQVQRGLGASRVAMNSVGGTVNIITKSTTVQSEGVFRTSISDYGNLKSVLSFSTGKMKNGISLMFLGSRTTGPGFVDATYVDGWAYFLSLNREFGRKHRLTLTAMGSPEKHGQRNYGMTNAEFDKYGVKYNRNWGTLNGKMQSLSENFYHKPQFNLNHYWQISPAISIATGAYVSFGKGGGKYTEAFNYGMPMWEYRKNDQIDFDQAFLINSTHTDSTLLADGSVVKGYSKNILTNYRADHYWAGVLSTVSVSLNKNLKIISGIHIRNFRSHLYEEIDNLMGGSFWVEQYAWSLAGVSGRNQVKKRGDVVNVDNYSMIMYGNLFGQAEYKTGNLTAFAASTISGTRYRREDPYNYIQNPLSDPVVKAGFDLKAGTGYKLGKYGNIYVNAGYYTREPYYKFVFVNFSNSLARNLANEKITSAEAGYTYESGCISARLNFYYTIWEDKSVLSKENIQLADSTLTRSLVRGLNAIHKGIEAEVSYTWQHNLIISATFSLAGWKWTNDVAASIFNDNQILVDSMMVYTKGLYVGDAPQTQCGLSAEYQTQEGFMFSADWVYYDRLYANFDPVNRNNADDQDQPFRIPGYSIFDLYAGYSFNAKGFPVSLQLACQNVFNKVTIIRGEDGLNHNPESFKGFWSLGRSFNLAAKISF